MKRALTLTAVALLAAACPPGQIDFCGKTCAFDSDCGGGTTCDPKGMTCQGGGCSSGGSTSGGSSGTTSHGGSSGGTSGSTAGVPYVGMPCTLPTGSEPDPCLADDAGLGCNFSSTTSTATACSLPFEYETCVAGVGCDPETPPLACTEFAFTGEPIAWFCVNDCTTTGQCPNAEDSCQSGLAVTSSSVCFTDPCGPGLLSDGGAFNGNFYGPCDSAGTNDGICQPFTSGGAAFGGCVANGPLQVGQEGCSDLRDPDGGTSTLCAANAVCVFAPNNSFCAPLCAAQAPTGPTCSGATTCHGGGDLIGACETPCTSGTTTCPSPFTCQGGDCLP